MKLKAIIIVLLLSITTFGQIYQSPFLIKDGNIHQRDTTMGMYLKNGKIHFGNIDGYSTGNFSFSWGTGKAEGDHSTAWGAGKATGFQSTAWCVGKAYGRKSTAWNGGEANRNGSTAWSNGKIEATSNYEEEPTENTAWAGGKIEGASNQKNTAWAGGVVSGGSYNTVFSKGKAFGDGGVAWSDGIVNGIQSTAWASGEAIGSSSTGFSYGFSYGDYSSAFSGGASYGHKSVAGSGGITGYTNITNNGHSRMDPVMATAFSSGNARGNRSTAVSGGETFGYKSFATGNGKAYGSFSVSLGTFPAQYIWGADNSVDAHVGDEDGSKAYGLGSIAMNGGRAYGTNSLAIGYYSKAGIPVYRYRITNCEINNNVYQLRLTDFWSRFNTGDTVEIHSVNLGAPKWGIVSAVSNHSDNRALPVITLSVHNLEGFNSFIEGDFLMKMGSTERQPSNSVAISGGVALGENSVAINSAVCSGVYSTAFNGANVSDNYSFGVENGLGGKNALEVKSGEVTMSAQVSLYLSGAGYLEYNASETEITIPLGGYLDPTKSIILLTVVDGSSKPYTLGYIITGASTFKVFKPVNTATCEFRYIVFKSTTDLGN